MTSAESEMLLTCLHYFLKVTSAKCYILVLCVYCGKLLFSPGDVTVSTYKATTYMYDYIDTWPR